MHRLNHVVNGNVALLGDSSGGVNAITGEGLRLCFRQALALADAMEADDLRVYEQRAHKKLMLRPAFMGKLMLVLAGNDMLRERAIRSMAAKPKYLTNCWPFTSGTLRPQGHFGRLVAWSAIPGDGDWSRNQCGTRVGERGALPPARS
jgi:flavin-dependent dehydrogenase